LNIFPDGGWRGLRVYGIVVRWGKLKPDELVDLGRGGEMAAVPWSAATCSLARCTSDHAGPPTNMGDGWETKRRRGPGNHWIYFETRMPGTLRKIE